MKETEQQIYAVLDSVSEGLTLNQLNSRLGAAEQGPAYWFNVTVLNNMERRGFINHDLSTRRYFIGRWSSRLR